MRLEHFKTFYVELKAAPGFRGLGFSSFRDSMRCSLSKKNKAKQVLQRSLWVGRSLWHGSLHTKKWSTQKLQHVPQHQLNFYEAPHWLNVHPSVYLKICMAGMWYPRLRTTVCSFLFVWYMESPNHHGMTNP